MLTQDILMNTPTNIYNYIQALFIKNDVPVTIEHTSDMYNVIVDAAQKSNLTYVDTEYVVMRVLTHSIPLDHITKFTDDLLQLFYNAVHDAIVFYATQIADIGIFNRSIYVTKIDEFYTTISLLEDKKPKG